MKWLGHAERLAGKYSSEFKNKTGRQIAIAESVNIAIAKMQNLSMRYGYHVATGAAYETVDLHKKIFADTLKGYSAAEIRDALFNFNDQVTGSRIDKFSELEMIDILSKV